MQSMVKRFLSAFICILVSGLCVTGVLANTDKEDFAAVQVYVEREYLSEDTLALDKFDLSGFTKNINSTFDESRSFSGSADSGVQLVFTIARKTVETGENGEAVVTLDVVETVETTVGATGLFKQKINLPMGDSVIIVEASKGEKKTVRLFFVKRLAPEIIEELKQSISVPGKSTAIPSPTPTPTPKK